MESYVASTIAKHIFSSFFMFAHFSSLKVCTCLSFMHNVTGHHGTSTEFLSCAFHFFFFVDAFNL